MPPTLASHLPVLQRYLDVYPVKSVLEFGMGDYSTPMFLERCERVVSLEMQSAEWYQTLTAKYGSNPRWEHHFLPGPQAAVDLAENAGERFDLVFVDGHGESRPAQIEAATKITYAILAHDTETPSYRWHLTRLPQGWTWQDIKSVTPWVSFISRETGGR